MINCSCTTNDNDKNKTNVRKIWIYHYLLMMMLHIHPHQKYASYYHWSLGKSVSLQHILSARSAQMSEMIQISATIIQPTPTIFNSKLLRQVCSLNLNAMNKIQIKYEHLQNDCKRMQPLHYPIMFWGHLVIGLLEVAGHSSRGWLCETLHPSQNSATIF